MLMLGPLLVALANDFGTSIAVSGQLAAATFVTQGITAPLVGPISDTYGRRPVLLIGLLLMVLRVLGSRIRSSSGFGKSRLGSPNNYLAYRSLKQV